MYWEQVLTEVVNKRQRSRLFRFTNIYQPPKQPKKCHKLSRPKGYQLGRKFRHAHFTKREAQCMLHLIHGGTISGIAKKLRLSPRTIESYLKNMKRKVQCHTKAQLISLVLTSDFLKNLDFT